MNAIWRASLAAGTMLCGLAPLAAHAGGSSGGSSGCHTCSVPTPCNCTVPTGHDVNVPGVNISPPSVVVNSPSVYITSPNIEVQTGSISVANSEASASASASSSSNASASGYANGYSLSNAVAASNVYAFGGGGGGGFSSGESGSSVIPNLVVEGIEAPAAQRVCAEMRAVAKVVAIQAVCLDDKEVPHPASQVLPDREIIPAYDGELYRCIAGARMQYTIGEYTSAADFSHGQTVSCLKGEALYHSASGQVACRTQKPARDCNERSLLRRYGAGIKVVKMMAAQQCVAWKTQTAAASASASETMVLDGGVGH